MKYTDPSGEIIGFIIAGVIIGSYVGGMVAEKGEYNPGKWAWDRNTWTGVAIGGVAGGVSGALVGGMWAAGTTVSIGANIGGNTIPLIAFSKAGFATANTVAGVIGIGGAGAITGSSINWSMVNASSGGVTPFDVGVEWLTGTGSRHRDFTNGDVFTEMLRQHDQILSTKASIPGMIANGQLTGNARYSLSGVQGVEKYLKDYSTLATGGLTGNLAVTYLGSYNLSWEVTGVNGNPATVQFLVNNSSTIQSATRPPVIGYYSWWQNSVGSWINSSFSSGSMSPTTQTFRWTETVTW